MINIVKSVGEMDVKNLVEVVGRLNTLQRACQRNINRWMGKRNTSLYLRPQ